MHASIYAFFFWMCTAALCRVCSFLFYFYFIFFTGFAFFLQGLKCIQQYARINIRIEYVLHIDSTWGMYVWQMTWNKTHCQRSV